MSGDDDIFSRLSPRSRTLAGLVLAFLLVRRDVAARPGVRADDGGSPR